MRIAILIVHHNLPVDTARCVESVRRQTSSPITVIDNGSRPDQYEQLLLSLGAVTNCAVFRSETNLGFADGVNCAFHRATGPGGLACDYTDVLLLNPDTCLYDGFFDAFKEARALHPKDILGGAMLDAAGLPIFTGAKFPALLFNQGQLAFASQIYEVAFVEGSACLIPKEICIARMGLFGFVLNSGYFIYWEDCELCQWASRNGFKSLIVPKARALHERSKTTGANSPLKTYYMTRNLMYVAKSNLGGMGYLAFFFYYILFCLLKCLTRDYSNPARGRYRLKGLIDGIFGVTGIRPSLHQG